MKPLKSIKQQAEWLHSNFKYENLEHKWSTRGMGSSRILSCRTQEVLGKAGGCGYDRRGTALGKALVGMFPDELAVLAKRYCKTKATVYYSSEKLYGLFYFHKNKTGAMIDGGCGFDCMVQILNAIGFSLHTVGSCITGTNAGSEFFTIKPLTKWDRARLARM